MVVRGIRKHVDYLSRKTIYIHFFNRKKSLKRTIQYLKDGTECFDDYFPCIRTNCKLSRKMNWLVLFVDMHIRQIMVRQRIVEPMDNR